MLQVLHAVLCGAVRCCLLTAILRGCQPYRADHWHLLTKAFEGGGARQQPMAPNRCCKPLSSGLYDRAHSTGACNCGQS